MLIQEGQDAKDSLKVYTALKERQDSLIAGLQREIVRKEGVIVRTLDQRNNCYNERKVLDEQMKASAAIVETQKETIRKLAKPDKRFGLGILAGYGATATGGVVRTGATLSAGLYFRLL